jgi:prepilin-type N-terminal cleavage/methylation domain-containing protein
MGISRATVREQRGFTLIELLVVIAIITLLMSILMPALNRAKKQARLVIDLSNLHQWTLAFNYFTEDNDGFFAVGTAAGADKLDWLDMLRPYFVDEELLFCPEARRPREEGGRLPFAGWTSTEDSGYRYAGSYGINYWVYKEHSAQSSDAQGGSLRWKTINVKGGGYIPLLVGASTRGALPHHPDSPPEYDGQDWASGSGPLHEIRRFCMNRHDGYVSGALFDASARKIGLKELWELRWSRHWYRSTDYDLTPSYAPPTEWDYPEHWMYGMKDYAN